MAFCGAVGNAMGNQYGALVQSSIETKDKVFSQSNLENAHSNYGFADIRTISIDGVIGGITGGFSKYLTIKSDMLNTPKVIEPYRVSVGNGSVIQYAPKPLTGILGNPVVKPSMLRITRPITIYSGITTFSNYVESAISSIGSNLHRELNR